MAEINWHVVVFHTKRMMRKINPRGNFQTQSPDDRERWSRLSARSRIELTRHPKPPQGSIGYETKRVSMPPRPKARALAPLRGTE